METIKRKVGGLDFSFTSFETYKGDSVWFIEGPEIDFFLERCVNEEGWCFLGRVPLWVEELKEFFVQVVSSL